MSTAGPRSASSTPAERRASRPPYWPIAITALVLAAALAPAPALRDAITLGPAPMSVRLARGAAYVVLAPFCDVFDALSLLSVRQHVALLLTLIVLYVLWRVVRTRRSPSAERRARRSLLREPLYAFLALCSLLAIYAAGVLVPRPMAALAVSDPQLVAVDFHSHTRVSHDAHHSFDVAANRAWHRDAGFDAAYITDHRSVAGAEEALRTDPRTAGEGTTLLPGIEVVWLGEHVNVLGPPARVRAVVDPALRDIRPAALDSASRDPATAPVLVQTIPGPLARVITARPGRPAGVRAIEVADGAPRGVEQTGRDHARILRLADSTGLALVAGSDNHGWGYTAQAWTLLRIDGWRALAPLALDSAIEQRIRAQGRAAARVVERNGPRAPASAALLLIGTAPAVAWRMLAIQTWGERLSWIVWVWVAALLVRASRRRTMAGRS